MAFHADRSTGSYGCDTHGASTSTPRVNEVVEIVRANSPSAACQLTAPGSCSSEGCRRRRHGPSGADRRQWRPLPATVARASSTPSRGHATTTGSSPRRSRTSILGQAQLHRHLDGARAQDASPATESGRSAEKRSAASGSPQVRSSSRSASMIDCWYLSYIRVGLRRHPCAEPLRFHSRQSKLHCRPALAPRCIPPPYSTLVYGCNARVMLTQAIDGSLVVESDALAAPTPSGRESRPRPIEASSSSDEAARCRACQLPIAPVSRRRALEN